MQENLRQAAKNKKALKAKTPTAKPPVKPPPPKKKGGVFNSLLAKLFGSKTVPSTVQQSIPYKEMYKDGICRVNDKLYTKTITFSDINYQLAQNEDKTQIFESYCGFLNYFDSTISIQLSFINKYGNIKDFEHSIDIPDRDDEYNSIRREYAEMMKNQLAKGNNGLVRRKYITFGIESPTLREAKPKLERIEADIIGNFKALGVTAHALNGAERLAVLHGQLHPDGKDIFNFDWKALPETGMTTKDFISPTSFDFRGGKTFRMGTTIGAVSFIQIIAPELSDRLLADYLEMNNAITVNLHIRSIEQSEAIKTIKRKITELDAMKINEQKKAVRSGYDMDVIPTDINTYGDEAKNMLKELQSRNERMFLVTVIVLNTAKTKQELENTAFAAAGIAQKHNCALKRLDWQQEQGLMSSLPIGLNQVDIQRGLTTSSTAIFVPFTTCELFMDGQALYYGLNALSNNMIMADRKQLKNPNGLFLGTPGCLVGETKIRLSDGNAVSLAELVESGVAEITVKAYDEIERRIIDAKAVDIRISKKTDTLKNLYLSDGSVISCTDTHLFLDHAGDYVHADAITEGQKLYGGHVVVRVSVTNLPHEIPVYDITVPMYSNFMLENGIIVHNSGKSFTAKREIINVFLICPDDTIFVADPEGEYYPVVSRLGGQVVKLSPTSTQYLNPMDINADYDDDDPLTLKSDFILSFCELIIGGKEGLSPTEKTIIDRCVRLVYREYLADPNPENMPILEDLYNLIRKQTEPEAQNIAVALEIYVTGSLNVFNHRTNVDMSNRLICFDIKELGKQLKKLGMLILQDAVWNRVTINRAAKKTTWFYIDEFHLLLKEEQTASYSIEIWKRFRKWGGIPTGITQNVKDLLASREIENIFENSDFILMLNQAQGDRQILAKQLGISPHQLSYVTQANAGEGLLFYGNTIIPFVDRYPKDTETYRIMTTKLSETGVA